MLLISSIWCCWFARLNYGKLEPHHTINCQRLHNLAVNCQRLHNLVVNCQLSTVNCLITLF
ncbi:hypothetical protein [Microcoleus sp. CAWBG58]|uniref:hypothetical protein n=1 Tax=Microcoleus sp. CAWBG58 TaxID=2841651 RepID=UPI0025ED9DEA|nr:hypothetical protein [Microcoleus sp. CAWBG58]